MTQNYIKIEKRNGKWWFVNSSNKKFISLGMNHVEAFLMTAPYNIKRTMEVYGEDFVNEDGTINYDGDAVKKWYSRVKKDFQEWNFNSFGYHHALPSSIYNKDYYYIEPIIDNSILIESYDDYPKIFTEEYYHHLEQIIKKVCNEHKYNPNLLGYAYHDIPSLESANLVGYTFENLDLSNRSSRIFVRLLKEKAKNTNHTIRFFHPSVQAFLSSDAQSPGKKEWINILRERYKDPQTASTVYNLNATSWNELLKVTEWPTPTEKECVEKDNVLMLQRIAERYYSIHYELIKKYDPNHLIFGDKYNGDTGYFPKYLLPILNKYIDVLFIDLFAHFEEQREGLIEIFEQLKKPILIGDAAFSVIQPNQIYTRGVICHSQQEVGENYKKFLRGLMELPFIVGWHHCGYMEGWNGLYIEGDPFSSMTSGFKDPFENVHEDAIVHVKEANLSAYYWHQFS